MVVRIETLVNTIGILVRCRLLRSFALCYTTGCSNTAERLIVVCSTSQVPGNRACGTIEFLYKNGFWFR